MKLAVTFYLLVLTLNTINKLLLNTVEGQLQPNITQMTATLSQGRGHLAATSLGELIFFGGGYNATATSAQVDIYNSTSGNWTTATLSVAHGDLAATSLGDLVFFAGGWNGSYVNVVDIYNVSSENWSTATLSQARSELCAASVSNLVFFAAGQNSSGYSNVVDIYSVANNTWTTATLSAARKDVAAVSYGDIVLFGGGYNGQNYSAVVDVYNTTNGIWSTLTPPLSVPRGGLVALSLFDLIFFAGGETNSGCGAASNVVDVYNLTDNSYKILYMSTPRCFAAGAATQNLILIGGGGVGNSQTLSGTVDVYNVSSGSWFSLTLSQARFHFGAALFENIVLFGGGSSWTYNGYNNVDIFIVPLLPPPPPPPPSPPPPPPQTPPIVFVPIWPPAFNLSTNITHLIPLPSSEHSSTISPPNTLPAAAIAGIVIGAVLLLIAGGIIFFILFLRKNRKKQKAQKNLDTLSPMEESSQNYVPISKFSRKENSREQSETEKSMAESIEEKQKQKRLSQILFDELVIEKELGEGSYGKVCLGKWNTAVVALKFCKKKGKLEEFLTEINTMVNLPPHPNVVQIFGVSLNGPETVLVLEYCAGGSLDKILFVSSESLSEETMMSIIRGIAAGMYHLHKHNIVHRDLAARNILLTSAGDPKISDFGMSRVLQERDEGRTYNVIGPIRWMAPESIGKLIYSKRSDVWTFGIVVWEIVARSEPHIDVDPIEVGVLIRDRKLIPKIPNECPPILREVMTMCWQQDPNQRPTFDVICKYLDVDP